MNPSRKIEGYSDNIADTSLAEPTVVNLRVELGWHEFSCQIQIATNIELLCPLGWAMALFEEFLGRNIVLPKPVPVSRWPLPIRLLARAQHPAERGVGDTLKRGLGDTSESFKKVMKRLGVECRRDQRQA